MRADLIAAVIEAERERVIRLVCAEVCEACWDGWAAYYWPDDDLWTHRDGEECDAYYYRASLDPCHEHVAAVLYGCDRCGHGWPERRKTCSECRT
jgi:hypothetical protein